MDSTVYRTLHQVPKVSTSEGFHCTCVFSRHEGQRLLGLLQLLLNYLQLLHGGGEEAYFLGKMEDETKGRRGEEREERIGTDEGEERRGRGGWKTRRRGGEERRGRGG